MIQVDYVYGISTARGRSDAGWIPVLLRQDGSVVVDPRSTSSWRRVNTNGTAVLKVGAGVLRRVVLTDGTAASVALHDGVSAAGPVIAVIPVASSLRPTSLEFDIPFSSGLTVVTSSLPDAIVVWD